MSIIIIVITCLSSSTRLSSSTYLSCAFSSENIRSELLYINYRHSPSKIGFTTIEIIHQY